MDLSPDTEAARARIAGLITRTPLMRSRWLSAAAGADVWLKLENLQVTGSFKIRGAANRILALAPEEAARGVIACSSGNHGLATAQVAGARGIPATICVPEWVDPLKLRAMHEAGATVLVEGATADEAEELSFRLQRERGLAYVHPFDDPEVIAGQGTIGHEILEDLPAVCTIVVPVSGGGLVGGIATAVKRIDPEVGVVGAYAERAPAMARSVAAGRPVRLPEETTIATALAGGIGDPNRHTLALVSERVDELTAVPEAWILSAMREAFHRHRLVVEGGGAVGLGAVLGNPDRWPGPVVIVVSGGNIDLRRLQEVLDADAAAAPRPS